jgi:Domain of unknown function (DUF4157)
MPEFVAQNNQTQSRPSSPASEVTPAHESLKQDWDKEALQGISVQRKLSIGAADDPLEQEADAMADTVMRMPETPFVQRKCAHCEEEEKVQRKPLAAAITPFIQTKGGDGGMASDTVTNQINTTRGSGSSMDRPTQSFMESRFGTDFSHVKIHTGDDAVQMSRELNAQAFTVGSDIYFNSGKYNPSSDSGKHLLAHELTHTVQQGGATAGMVQREVIENCSTPQNEAIAEAITQAYSYLGSAIRALQAPLTIAARNALWLAFRTDTEDVAQAVLANLQHIRNNITRTTYRCNQPSDSNYGADCANTNTFTPYGYVSRTSVCGNGQGRPVSPIYLCIPSFTNLGMVKQGLTIIHEAAHLFLNICDTGYFTDTCGESAASGTLSADAPRSGTAGDNPALRLNNADAYACLVHFLVHTRAAQAQASADAFRGNNLQIRSDEGTVIFTQTRRPSSPTFYLDGIPGLWARRFHDSGFQFRWTLLGGNSINYSLYSEYGSDAAVLDGANVRVSVSQMVRTLLEGNNVSSATIICTIEVVSGSGDRFAPVMLERRLSVSIVAGQDPFDL